MVNELHWQKRILDAVKSEGGKGWKNSNMAIAGIPDLVLLLPNLPAVFMEVKLIKSARDKVETTILQEYTLNKLREIKSNILVITGVISSDVLFMFPTKNEQGRIPIKYVTWEPKNRHNMSEALTTYMDLFN